MIIIKVLELFAGTRSIGKAFEKRGHEVFSVEWNKDFENIDLYKDISELTSSEILEKFGHPDVIWMSPDCTTFSIAAISHHRRKNEETGNLDPVSEYAKFCDKVDQHCLDLIRELKPTYYFIENPRGGMRKMTWIQGIPRYTVTYCQYGDNRMKPTDIWSNHPMPDFIKHFSPHKPLNQAICESDLIKFLQRFADKTIFYTVFANINYMFAEFFGNNTSLNTAF